MRISQVRIHNYRSIRDLSFDVTELTVLLGPNNHGKSNILRAIEFALSTSAKVDSDDLFALREDGDDELWVELTFVDLTEQERTTFEKYLRNDGSIRIRKTARLGASGATDVEYRGYAEEPDLWWLKATAADRLGTREAVQAEGEAVPELLSLLDGGGRITRQRLEEFQKSHIEQHRNSLTFREVLEANPLLGQKNVAGGLLPDFYLVPAIRDLSEETRAASSSTLGRLLQRATQEMTERDPRFVDIRERMARLVEELNARPDDDTGGQSQLAQLEGAITDELQSWDVKVAIKVTPPEMGGMFGLGTQLHLDDGLMTPANRKGHGLQRALLFALIRAWAKALRTTTENGATAPRRASDSIVFAIEEPELFLHPHAQRQLEMALREIASAKGHQVFVCSHSTHFVNLDYYRSIAIVTKKNADDGTSLRQCRQDLFGGSDAGDKKDRFNMAAWVNPDRGEMFFAKKVVLVEGATEKTVLPFIASKLGCFDAGISIIDCGSKHNLPLYISILNAFKLEYTVIHDEDPLPSSIPPEWSEDKRREKQHTFRLNRAIAELVDGPLGDVRMCQPDFEAACGVSRRQCDKQGKPIAALNHFSPMPASGIPAGLADIVRDAYRCGSASMERPAGE